MILKSIVKVWCSCQKQGVAKTFNDLFLLYITMYEKDYQKTFTQRKFQQSQIFLTDQNSVILTTSSEQTSFSQLEYEGQRKYKYSSYIVSEDAVKKLQDLRILDVQRQKTQNRDLNREKEDVLECVLCNNFEVNKDKFAKKYKDYFSKSLVNLLTDTPHLARLLSNEAVLKISRQKDKLYLQDFNWNALNYDVFDTLPKSKTNYRITKKHRTLLDLHMTSYNNEQIENLTVLNKDQVLLHIGRYSQLAQKNILMCKFDISQEQIGWKQEVGQFHTFYNKNVQINHNSFLNGVYDFQDHTSTLKMYDYRSKGEVLNVLSSTAQEFVRAGRNCYPDLQFLQSLQEFEILGIVASRGGRINQPFLVDIRIPQKCQMINPRKVIENFSFVKQIRYKKPYLFTIERQFQQYSFKIGRFCRYELQI